MDEVRSQQPSSDERLLDFSQGVRVQVHVGDGLLNQLTSNTVNAIDMVAAFPDLPDGGSLDEVGNVTAAIEVIIDGLNACPPAQTRWATDPLRERGG